MSISIDEMRAKLLELKIKRAAGITNRKIDTAISNLEQGIKAREEGRTGSPRFTGDPREKKLSKWKTRLIKYKILQAAGTVAPKYIYSWYRDKLQAERIGIASMAQAIIDMERNIAQLEEELSNGDTGTEN